jgi:hypothetical protein
VRYLVLFKVYSCSEVANLGCFLVHLGWDVVIWTLVDVANDGMSITREDF